MTWAPRDVVSIVLVVALAVAFDAVVIAAAARGDLTATGEAVTSAFLLLAAILVAVLGIHLNAHPE